MRADGAAHGVGTIPRRKVLKVLLAIVAVVVIAAMVALVVWTAPLARSGVGEQDAMSNAEAGSAVIRDDAGAVHSYTPQEVHPWVNLRDDEGEVHRVKAH